MDNFLEDFHKNGFLFSTTSQKLQILTQECDNWINFTNESCDMLMEISISATDRPRTSPCTPKSITTCIALRSYQTLQAVILLAERGMISEARMLTRSLIENAIILSALPRAPKKVITALKSDSRASDKRQANFILNSKKMDIDETKIQKLREIVEQIGKTHPLNVKNMEDLCPTSILYPLYQRLSDDAAHLTARSLHRHVNQTRQGWHYRWGPGSADDIAATLYHAVLAIISITLAITQILKNKDGEDRVRKMHERFLKMPKVEAI